MKRFLKRITCLVRGHKMTLGTFRRYDNFAKEHYISYEWYCSRCGKNRDTLNEV